MASGTWTAVTASRLTLEVLADLINEIGRQTGLGNESIASGSARTLPFGRERVRTQRDDQQMIGLGSGLEHSSRLPAVDSWKRQIHQNQIRLQGTCLVNGLATISSRIDTKTAELEVVPVHFSRVVEILHDENQRFGFRIAHAGLVMPGGIVHG
jgi:hypothetical protein